MIKSAILNAYYWPSSSLSINKDKIIEESTIVPRLLLFVIRISVVWRWLRSHINLVLRRWGWRCLLMPSNTPTDAVDGEDNNEDKEDRAKDNTWDGSSWKTVTVVIVSIVIGGGTAVVIIAISVGRGTITVHVAAVVVAILSIAVWVISHTFKYY